MPKKATTKKRAAPRKTAVRRTARRVTGGFRRVSHSVGGTLGKMRWLEMLLFYFGGNYLGKALSQTGIPIAIYNSGKVPFYNAMMDEGYRQGNSYGVTTNKAVGVALLVHSLYESRKGGVKPGVLNAELPFAIGSLTDPEPGQEQFGLSRYSSSRWYS